MNHKWQSVAGIVAAISLLAGAGCRQEGTNDATANSGPTAKEIQKIQEAVPKPNILIWLVDTLRADHLSVYGYSRNTSPQLDKFAKDAIVFENAYAPSSWTKPSTASLLTGVNPNRHGAVGYYGRLSGARLIGEYVKPLGYQTAAFATNPWIRPFWGFEPGFDTYGQDPWDLFRHSGADKVAANISKTLDQGVPQPFLFYVHTLDPHDGYAPPPPYDTMWGPRLKKRATSGRYIWNAPPHIVEDMIKGYDGDIAFGDHYFGRVLDTLKQRGLYEDSLIIFTADHGEEFFEHGHGGHGRTLYESLVHVPLIVKFPKNILAGQRAPIRVSLIDVLPTILSYLHLPGAEHLDGMSLIESLDATPDSGFERVFFMQTDHTLTEFRPPEQSVLRGVLLGRHKYVDQTKPHTTKILLDIASDPEEKVDLLSSEAEVAADLASLLASYVTESEPGIHFRNVNVIEKTTQKHTFQIKLRTEGQFVGLQKQQFEEEDLAEISENKKALSLVLHSVNRNALMKNKQSSWVIDEDSILFHVEPSDAKIVVEQYECDKAPDLSLYVGSASKKVDTFPYEFSTQHGEVIATNVGDLVPSGEEYSLTGPAGGYLAVVPPRSRAKRSDLDEAMIKKLKSLGYVGGD